MHHHLAPPTPAPRTQNGASTPFQATATPLPPPPPGQNHDTTYVDANDADVSFCPGDRSHIKVCGGGESWGGGGAEQWHGCDVWCVFMGGGG